MKCKKCEQETPFEKVERNAVRSHWKCPKCYEWHNLGKQCYCSPSELNDVLCALTRKWEEKISELRDDMHQAAVEMNAGKRAEILQVIETYHDCIDDLNEEIST